MFGREKINDPYDTMGTSPAVKVPRGGIKVSGKDGRARPSGWQALVAANPDLSYRDMRDLLMEYGADGTTAGNLASGQPHAPGSSD